MAVRTLKGIAFYATRACLEHPAVFFPRDEVSESARGIVLSPLFPADFPSRGRAPRPNNPGLNFPLGQSNAGRKKGQYNFSLILRAIDICTLKSEKYDE